jgi:prepilin-type N-terminal cleavage/methylation domain-containing protein
MTTSETGDPGGFTLIEILLVLALIALFGWIFIGGSAAMMTDRAMAPDDQFWKACAAARKEALEEQQSVLLSFDPKAHAFIFNDGSKKTSQVMDGPQDLLVDFHPAESAGAALTLVGGTLVETQPLTSVTFYSDGTCTPFRAQLHSDGGAHILAVDPWTCAPVLAKTDATP